MTSARNYGFTCWQYHHCGRTIECGDVDAFEAENIAGSAGWAIGHADGQGHIACPTCRDTLFDPHLLGTDAGRAALNAAAGEPAK